MKVLTIFILIIVALVIGFLGYRYLYQRNYPPSSPLPSPEETLGQANFVSIENLSFVPSQITVPRGTQVIFENNESVTHTVTFNDFGSNNLNQGDRYEYTFDQAGTFDYYCNIHPFMKGTVIVQ